MNSDPDSNSNNMLSAGAKHGANISPGEYRELVKTTTRWKNWIDNRYHELMLVFMIIELILLVWIAWKK